MPKQLPSSRYKAAIFVYVFALIVVRALFISYSDPKGRSNGIGDGPSDVNTHSAVKYFYDYGFWESRLRPMHGYDGINKANAYAYTHYPALPDVIMGAYAKLIGSTDERALRTLPILLSVLFFFFIFYALREILRDERSAFLSASLLVLSNYFLVWSDTLHKHTFEEFLKWIIVFLMIRYFSRRVAWIPIAIFFLSLVAINISFEPPVYLGIAAVGLALGFEGRRTFWKNPLIYSVVLGSAAGFFLHLYMNSLYLGSFSAAVADIKGALHNRSGACEAGEVCNLTFFKRLKIPLIILNRFEFYFLIPGGAVFYFAYLALKKYKLERPDLYVISLALFAASVGWYFTLTQHAILHSFVGKQMGMFFGVVVGTGLLEYFRIYGKFWRAPDWRMRLVHLGFWTYIVGMALTQQIYKIHWLYGFKSLF